MKGLLLKDWYMIKKYCRAYFLVAAVFTAVALVNDTNMFFAFYPCLLCGMLPATLLAYDERSRWTEYSGTLPCTKAQLVSAKYLIGLLAQLSMLTLTGIAQGIRMHLQGRFSAGSFIVLLLLILSVSTLTASFYLPFVFRLGVEKGRTAYYVMVVSVCVAGSAGSSLLGGQLQPSLLLVELAFAGVCIYALSWFLSIRLYEKREL